MPLPRQRFSSIRTRAGFDHDGVHTLDAGGSATTASKAHADAKSGRRFTRTDIKRGPVRSVLAAGSLVWSLVSHAQRP